MVCCTVIHFIITQYLSEPFLFGVVSIIACLVVTPQLNHAGWSIELLGISMSAGIFALQLLWDKDFKLFQNSSEAS